MIRGDAHPRANTECVDEGPITYELIDSKLVEPATGKDPHLGEPGAVQQPAPALRESDQVTAVDADTETAAES